MPSGRQLGARRGRHAIKHPPGWLTTICTWDQRRTPSSEMDQVILLLGDRGFESISLQQTVRLSREIARRGRGPRLFARVCGPWEVARSVETATGWRHGAYRRECLCRAKFQYRSASDVVQRDRRACGAKLVLAQPVKRSRALSVARARSAADASAPTACPRSDRAADARRGWRG